MTSESRPKGRQARQLEARDITRRAILDAALDLFIARATRRSPSATSRRGWSTARRDLRLLRLEGRDLLRARRRGLRDLGARELADAPSADPIEDVRASVWRLYEFSKDQPQYFALVFLDRHVPRVSRSTSASRSSRRCAAARWRAWSAASPKVSSRRRRTPRWRCGCCGRPSSASRRCGCRTGFPRAWTSMRWCATPSRRRLPAFARVPRGMRGRSRAARGRSPA